MHECQIFINRTLLALSEVSILNVRLSNKGQKKGVGSLNVQPLLIEDYLQYRECENLM